MPLFEIEDKYTICYEYNYYKPRMYRENATTLWGLNESMYYTYILECADGTYYTGYTDDVKKREQVHNSGKGAKYTRSRLPVKVIYTEEYETKSEAMKREAAIKALSRKKKEEIVSHGKN